MGLFGGLVSLAISPVKIAVKSVDSALNEDWNLEDVCTLGATKVLKETIDAVDDAVDDFKE